LYHNKNATLLFHTFLKHIHIALFFVAIAVQEIEDRLISQVNSTTGNSTSKKNEVSFFIQRAYSSTYRHFPIISVTRCYLSKVYCLRVSWKKSIYEECTEPFCFDL